MKYKNKFFYLIVIFFVFSFCSSEPTQEEIQAQIDAAVEQAVEEALANTSSVESTTTTTVLPELNLDGSYWGLYDNGTWATAPSSKKPENFEWAWDIFKQYPSIEFTIEDFHEDSTLIGSLVNFDCSFNRISKTEEHKAAFGVDENTIEYYDTYLEWAQDNYDYLTEDAVITISKIMRGVWTCDYEYLESISTEYLDFVNSGDAYAEVPRLSEYIASFENNYDDDHRFGKYTYTLGALLYMTPTEETWNMPEESTCRFRNETQYVGSSPGIIWPLESINPKQLRENQITQMSMFDNGITKSLIDGTYQGDGGSYGFRLKISSDGVWYSYKYTGHPWRSNYATSIPAVECIASPEDIEMQDKTNSARSSDTAVEGEVNSSYISSYYIEQENFTVLTDVRIEIGSTFDSLVIESIKQSEENDLLPGPYSIQYGGTQTLYVGMLEIPTDFEEYLIIRISATSGLFSDTDREFWVSTWAKERKLITADGSKLVAKFEPDQSGYYFILKIEPGSNFRSYRTANPPSFVVEVEK
jgi:hypothetical protein